MLRIVKATDPITIDRVNLCIYAAPGLGKTSLSFTADSPLNLDFDRGTHRAAIRKDTAPITSWKDVVELTPEDLAPYRTIIVDTAGRALDFLTQDIIAGNPKMGRGGALTLQGFGELKSKFAAWLKMLNASGKDVVLIAHMDEQRSGDEVIERLDVQGGSKGEIYKSVDAMGRIRIENKQRVIDFSPRENAFGKNPCNLDLIQFPDPHVSGDTLAKVIQTIKAKINQLSAEQQDQQQIIEEWAEALKDFSTAEDFNRSLSEFKAAPQSVQTMARKRAKDLGLVLNRTTLLYEDNRVTA